MFKYSKFSIALSCLMVLSACDTAPSQPQVQLTPREACLADARREAGFCALSVFGVQPGARQAASERCKDREQMQEDRCYARFK